MVIRAGIFTSTAFFYLLRPWAQDAELVYHHITFSQKLPRVTFCRLYFWFYLLDNSIIRVYTERALNEGPAMSLRKSPTLTPALMASNRNNAKKSTGPRTARGKAWSGLNRMRHGGRSREYRKIMEALFCAPPCQMAETAMALLANKPAIHPIIEELARLFIQAETDICSRTR